MNKHTPPASRIFAMVLFALSCFGILIYLWLVFGGALPLKPEGYRVNVAFPEATTLAQEADVRISGVNVGKVKVKELPLTGNKTDVVLEIDAKYAPLPKDVNAMLRQKTLLGETYVELTPGTKSGEKIPDGGRLAGGRVSPTVELDEIFRAFDEPTRQAFQSWMDQQGRAIYRNGSDLNAALGNLAPFAEDTATVLKILDEEEGDVRSLVRDTGEVFAALTERSGQLRGLIQNSNKVFETTAARDRELADTFRVLPTFLDESEKTLTRLTAFAEDTNPLITQLRPFAREVSPTLIELRGLAPDLKALFRDVDPLVRASRRGLPALESFLDETRPLLAQVDPFLRQLNPFLRHVGFYRRELTAFFALDAASTQAADTPLGAENPVHYLRTSNPVNPENLAAYPVRLSTNRSNPYMEPGGYGKLATGLEVFGKYLCTNNPLARLAPDIGALVPQETVDLVERIAFNGGPVPAPPCKEQAPLGTTLYNQPGRYPHVVADPEQP